MGEKSMSLTCLSCKLLFSVPELHQEHYKTDWHRYNLKRRLAELPPLTKEDFDRRAAAFKEDVEGKDKKVSSSCEICNKHFSTKNAMASHLQSKKHKALAIAPRKAVLPKKVPKSVSAEVSKPSASATPMDVEVNDDDDEEWSDEGDEGDWESCDDSENEDGMKKIVIETNDCLFCDHQSDSAESNVLHMSEVHSFFIPDVEYLTDLDGLIACLAVKIQLHHLCLWCDGKGKGFRSVKSVQRHMLDKGHCKMLHEGEALADYEEFYDFSSIDLEKEFGDVNVIDEFLEDKEGNYLVLPSGAMIGHRSLAQVFKQNLQSSSNNQHKSKKVLTYYKALGYTGNTAPALVKKARDISYMRRIKDRYNLKLGQKQNKFQPHFRRQVMF